MDDGWLAAHQAVAADERYQEECKGQGVWRPTRCAHECHEAGAESCKACQHMHPPKRQADGA